MKPSWIKMRKNLLTDPKVVRIASACNADRLRTIGALFSAWCLLDEHTQDGHLVGYDFAALDEIVGVAGLAEAMESVGWLERTTQGIAAPRFSEHNGQTAKRRAAESVRKMSARASASRPHDMRTNCAPRERERERDIPPSAPPGGGEKKKRRRVRGETLEERIERFGPGAQAEENGK